MGLDLGRRICGLGVPLALALVAWQVAAAADAAPQPNPLAPLSPGASPFFAPVPGADLTRNGPAAGFHGDPSRGRALFARICVVCHGDRGTGGVPNPGSDDGTVPPLNPIDPAFLQEARGDPATFARAVDRFVQHGSRPSGQGPELSMIPWGDRRLLSQPEIADVEAYVLQLNGVSWPDRWAPPAEVRMEAARDGDTLTYRITLVNHGSGALGALDLTDTLPPGLTYVASYVPAPGQNAGSWSGSTVECLNADGVPRGGTLGPFVIVTRLAGAAVPANVARLTFTWATWDGATFRSSAVSEPTLPGPRPVVPLFSLGGGVPR